MKKQENDIKVYINIILMKNLRKTTPIWHDSNAK